MNVDKIRSCISLGLCKVEQVQATLQRAQYTDAAIDLFMRGDLSLNNNAQAMLSRLIATGVVPGEGVASRVSGGAAAAWTDADEDNDEDDDVPELLYCLKVLRTLPAEVPPPTMDAMFGQYRGVELSGSWVRERFGECDTHFGPHHFFAYHAYADGRNFATVWARAGESHDELLLAQLTARFEPGGVISLQRELE